MPKWKARNKWKARDRAASKDKGTTKSKSRDSDKKFGYVPINLDAPLDDERMILARGNQYFSRLLRLPTEIRAIIFSMVYTGTGIYVFHRRRRSAGSGYPTLVSGICVFPEGADPRLYAKAVTPQGHLMLLPAVCRQLYAETPRILLQTCNFYIQSTYAWSDWTKRIGPFMRSNIAHIHMPSGQSIPLEDYSDRMLGIKTIHLSKYRFYEEKDSGYKPKQTKITRRSLKKQFNVEVKLLE